MRSRLRDSLFGTSKVPIRIDRYVIVDELGAGGLGVVYRAYDPKLDRKVALKVIRPERTSAEDSAARMEREAQAMARLAHPNVVVVHDTGHHAGGVFIAMECLNGTRLDHWSRERQSDWKAIRDVVCDAGRGLAAAHAAGLVHRDFKPANVLVTTETVAKVLDFGLAQASASSPVSTTAGPVTCAPGILTETGVVMGTPAFMSPEQFEGQTDPRSDQWSFCISAWQCFVGERPYVTSEVDELRMLIRTAPPDVPTQASAPGWVFRVLRRGLSPNPQDRYPSMDALLSALERDKRSRRRQRFGLLGAVVLSASLGATAMALFEPTPSAQVVSEVDALEAQAREAARRGHFVFPPSTDRSAQTSLLLVLALEQLEGDGGELASARATTLRKELAAKLVELGDTYADLEGAEAFAADYYASALLFDPEEPRARARAGLTPGELAALRKHASDGSFTDAELAGADVLAELAQEPKEGRAQRLAKVKTTRRAVAQPPAAPSPRPADPPAAAAVDPTPSEASSPRSPRDSFDPTRARADARRRSHPAAWARYGGAGRE
jgi:predicted Ser/Thr protein kinase